MPPPFSLYPDTTAITPPPIPAYPHNPTAPVQANTNTHDGACRTRQANPIPGHTTPAHRDNPITHPDHEPASEAPHTRQTRHTGTKDYCLRRSIPSRMRRHTQPRRKTPGNDTIAWHPPARACPRIHNDALPAYRASRAPASGVRRMSRHTHLKKLLGPHGKPGCTPRGRQGHGKHIRCHDTPTATTPAGIISNNPRFLYATEAHQTNQPHLTIHQRNQFGRRQDCLQCVETTRRPWLYRPVNQKSTASGSLHAPPMPRSSSITCMSSSVNSKSNTSIFDRIRFICTDFGSGNTSCCNAQRTQT